VFLRIQQVQKKSVLTMEFEPIYFNSDQHSYRALIYIYIYIYIYLYSLVLFTLTAFVSLVLHFAFWSFAYNTQHNIHAPGGIFSLCLYFYPYLFLLSLLSWIRTRNPSKLATADSRIRPLCHWALPYSAISQYG
jgi:hypothetical protein